MGGFWLTTPSQFTDVSTGFGDGYLVRFGRIATARIGQKQSLAETMPNVRFPIRKRTFEPIAAAQKDLFVGYVSFGISNRKQLVGADFIAL
jgi:hypothetical protein